MTTTTKETKTSDKRAIKRPVEDAVLDEVVAIAQSVAHSNADCAKILELLTVSSKDALEDGKVKTDSDIEKQLQLIYKDDPEFHKLPTVQSVVKALVLHEPVFPAYETMMTAAGCQRGLSKTKIYIKGGSFHSHTIERLNTLNVSDSRWSELVMWINGNSRTYRRVTIGALLSPKFVCAGQVTKPAHACKHGCVVMDNKEGTRDLSTFELDHLIGFNNLYTIWKRILKEIAIATSNVRLRQSLRDKLKGFIRHLALGTTGHGSRSWPANVYARCDRCNKAGNQAAGGSTHPAVWSD